jgi:cupin fold WbuC family metalloprotein
MEFDGKGFKKGCFNRGREIINRMILIDKDLLDPVLKTASGSERKRFNYNFHKTLDDTLHRMLNVLKLGTYVRPHKHQKPDKREAFIILEGKVAVLEFDDIGNLDQFTILDRKNRVYGCEIAPGVWHSIICMEDNSVIYEIKDGPYLASTDKNFASWSPEEGSPEAKEYLEKLLSLIVEF